MSSIEVRPFRRSDRQQLTDLVNSHAHAVVPGMGVSVSALLSEGERLSRHGGWAELGNLHVSSQHRRQGVATWLIGQAAEWLHLAQVERLLSYAWLDGQDPTGQDDTAYRASWRRRAFCS